MAAQCHAKVVELASQRLHSTRAEYLEALSWYPLDENTYVVILKESALWLEEGKSPGSMVDDLLRNNPKISKEGKKYKVIPFKHAEPESQTPMALHSLEDTLRQELKKRKVPITKIEKNPDGSPKLGLLHKFNIDSEQKGPTGTPFLHGVRIYQHAKPGGGASRSIMTFRVVSEDHKAQGRWFHPGLEAKNFLDQAFRWSEALWENEILPDLVKG